MSGLKLRQSSSGERKLLVLRKRSERLIWLDVVVFEKGGKLEDGFNREARSVV